MGETQRISSLIAGGPLTTREITLKAGESRKAGALLGKIASSGDPDNNKYVLSVQSATNGSGTPDLVLVEDCDATSGDKITLAYETGRFNVEEMTIDSSHSIDSIREGLRLKGILFANVD
jgi:hypothetical protein